MDAMNAIGAAIFLGILAVFALIGAYFAMIGSVAFTLICVGVIVMAAAGAVKSLSST